MEHQGISKALSFSVCMPAFNEEENLRGAADDLIKTLSFYVKEIEIIIVDDGSTDNTLRVAKEIAQEYPEAKVLHHKKRLGIGACYHDALAVARGDYFSWFPADHENSAAEFIKCLPYLTNATIVTCHHLGQDPRSVWRRCVSRSYTWVLNKYFHLNLKYYNGLTIFPTPLLHSLSLVSHGFLFTAENIIKAIKKGYRVIELSVPLVGRKGGNSKIFTILSISQTIKDILYILKYKN